MCFQVQILPSCCSKMSNDLLQIHVLIEVRRCGSCLVLHMKHPSIPKPVWRKLTEPMSCPFSSTFRRCVFVRQVELAPGRVLPSGHARTQPAMAFPAQTAKIGWTYQQNYASIGAVVGWPMRLGSFACQSAWISAKVLSETGRISCESWYRDFFGDEKTQKKEKQRLEGKKRKQKLEPEGQKVQEGQWDNFWKLRC